MSTISSPTIPPTDGAHVAIDDALTSQVDWPISWANVSCTGLPVAAVRRAVTRTALAEFWFVPVRTVKVFAEASQVPNSMSSLRRVTDDPSAAFWLAIQTALFWA